MNKSRLITPSMFVQNKGEKSVNVALSLTRAKRRNIIRLTGGCGYMTDEYYKDMEEIVQALIGFDGAILFGGTRMLKRNDPSQIVPGITEIPPQLRAANSDSILLGVVPKTGDLELSEIGMIVSKEEDNDYVTIIHPYQDSCLIVQESVDKYASWETEYEECMNIVHELREYVGWDSLLISYNGGGVTEKEILATAEVGWPVLLIRGSGRKTDEYSQDEKFLEEHTNVHVADTNALSISRKLCQLGFLDDIADARRYSFKLIPGGING